MSISAEQFAHQLNSSSFYLKPAYLIMGKNQFSGIECATLLTTHAKKNGFDEREVFYINARFDARLLSDALQSQSLFSSKKIVEVRFESDKFTKKESDIILSSLSKVNQNLLIIQGCSLNSKAQQEKHFLLLQQRLEIINCPAVFPSQFKKWTETRLKQLNLKVSEDALNLIINASQGNLFWTHQIMLQLQLLANEQSCIQAQHVREMLSDQSIFQISDLLDALLQQSPDALHILHKLRVENTSPILINSILTKEINLLLQLIISHNKNDVFDRFKIWPNRRAIYQRTHGNFHPTTLQHALALLADLDKSSKGVGGDDEWLLLEKLAFTLSNQHALTH